MLIDNFVPRDESARLERRAKWDEEEDEWVLPALDPAK
eukprot:CAMPEP_0168315702 /NCGR_PEP_ID=MMETSP0210-20121227/12424_1 /TAXON_ID=40633 /ORGANISM="Condylostoma magnum, Strain COL2" /LENGTH=37 /DNA_ID= /DNA_START= /DNA_END= /DNA_ORIENTATION=